MASSSSVPHRWKYDVFVSFRGEDIRKNFMDHLFSDFKQKGIYAFRDDNDLPKGEEISHQLYKAIEESRFLIVIFSKTYASSSWCLRELVKILECKKMENPKYEVLIIFYDAKPDVVRKQKRSYGEAFGKHEVSNKTEVDKWKEALSMAANLSGWDLQDMTNGYESKFIDSISKEILKQLCDGPLHVGENLVGVDIHLDKLDLLRFVGSDKVNMIGICGISGLGKTTLAKAIYNLMYIRFEGSSFCDVQGVSKRQGLTQVQMQLIDDIMKTTVKISNVDQGIMVIKKMMSSKPIMLVLDDVDHWEQLEALAGSPSWFCPGSLIIFTGKDKQLLSSHGMDEIHDMEFLDEDQSLELFSSYAFEEKQTPRGFEELAVKAVKYVQGHPLALKILGRFLLRKTVREWVSELDSLEEHPNEQIQKVLRLSYDGLDPRQKNILLDIACLFIGENSDFAASVLANFYADTNMRVLVDKSLITISRNMSIQMHDMIRAMAREIVREESTMLGKQRRLWIPSEVYDVLSEAKVTITEAVEVLVLLLEKSCKKFQIDTKAFAHMKKLRILKIYQKEKYVQELELKGYNVNFSGSLSFLSNELRLFYWHGFPFKDLPSDFYPENIVAIDLSYSHIKHLWTTPKCLRRLKVMKLSYCCNLRSTPDCTEITNLEELYLDGCVNLVEVHPSIGMLKRLAVLNMSNCKCLKSFPSKLEMDSLQVLNISGCSLMDQLPEVLGWIKTFGLHERIQSRWWTSISRAFYLPSKQERPQSLVLSSLTGLPLLRSLDLSYCNILQVPDSIGGLSCLQELYLKGNNFTSLPESLSRLSSLYSIHLNDCKKLEVLPDLPHGLRGISATDCTSLREVLGSSDHQPLNRDSYFTNCPRLFKHLVTIDSQVSVNQTQCLDSSIDSQGSTNQQLSSVLRYTRFPTNICEFFSEAANDMDVDIVYHADSNIPKWFRNQSMGNHVKVELPSDWSYTKFRGFATCVVFKRKKPGESLMYSVKNFDGTLIFVAYINDHIKKERWIGINEPYMIWLRYTTVSWGWEKAKNYVTFHFEGSEDFFEVKEFGVRVVYDEDLQQTTDLLSMLPTPTQDGGYMSLFHVDDDVATCWSW